MPKYFYTAKTEQGETKTGIVEAKDEQDLARNLRQAGLFLISCDNQDYLKGAAKAVSFLSKGVGVAEKLFFIRNLEVMVTAGISLPRAVSTLAAQSQNKRFKRALAEIEGMMIRGQSLSEGMKLFPNIFPDIFQSMIKVGEESGTLDKSLKALSSQLEREKELKSKIVSALIYPIVIISAMSAIGFAMLITVIPQLAETFKELDLALPITTRIVIGLGTGLKKYWYLIPLVIAGIFFVLKAASRSRAGKLVVDKVALKIPVVSRLIKEIASASLARTLASLITSGVPLVRSLEIISGTLGNIHFKEALLDATEKIKKGLKLSEALKPYANLFLPIVIQMTEVGEETGETAQVLGQLAVFLEEGVTNSTKNIAALVEPILMLLIGAAVGFFAISMIQPMYSMLEVL